ncbi:hypothetical protein EN45_111660 [Penicillium chrysogenum]|uniref:Uncharacterized protein n=1 Tax=Penicillium chrysogenum TaxID=5076 RepID=A0A167PZD4_PENCH|nr:hypothetical protein EN45_111660 [Penicillium chrysogenum]
MGTKFDLTVKPVTVQGVSLAGKTALVTGSNTGVGLETSRQLLELGLSKLIIANLSDVSIGVWELDQSDYDSIVAFAERTKSLSWLDIVVLNIGIVNATRVFNPKTDQEEMT